MTSKLNIPANLDQHALTAALVDPPGDGRHVTGPPALVERDRSEGVAEHVKEEPGKSP